jgi:hypothetical protein
MNINIPDPGEDEEIKVTIEVIKKQPEPSWPPPVTSRRVLDPDYYKTRSPEGPFAWIMK